MKRKVLAMLLAAVMAIGLLPTVFAAEFGYGTPKELDLSNSVIWSAHTLDGETITNRTYEGKIQVLIFYRANGTCFSSNGTIQAIAGSSWIKDGNVQVIAFGVGESGESDATVKSNAVAHRAAYAPDCTDIEFAYLSESARNIMWEYARLVGFPSGINFTLNVIIDSSGTVRYAWMNGSGDNYYDSCIAQLEGRTPAEPETPAAPVSGARKLALEPANVSLTVGETATLTVVEAAGSIPDPSDPYYFHAMELNNNIDATYNRDGDGPITFTLKGLREGLATFTVYILTASGGACELTAKVTVGDPASGVCGDGLTWRFSDGVLTIAGKGPMTDFAYDHTYENIPWHYYLEQIHTVMIGDGVTSIGQRAFTNLVNLTRAVIPNSVTSIGMNAFYECGKLADVTIPAGVTSIEANTFYGCGSLLGLAIPDGVTSIGANAFWGCGDLGMVTIPASVTTIGSNAFMGCYALTDIHYGGSESQWKQVKGVNRLLSDAMIHYGVTPAKPETAKPETTKPEATKPEATDSAPAAPGAAGPEASKPGAAKTSFTDVPAGVWYEDAVHYAVAHGLINGMDAAGTVFAPEANNSRAMFITILARRAGADTTADGGHWYDKAIAWGVANHVTDGSDPESAITREQIITMLWRYEGYSNADLSVLDKFPDKADIHDWDGGKFRTAMAWAVENGVIAGSDGKLLPRNNITRAQTAQILMNYCKKYGVEP